MTYIRPPNTVLAGKALKQTPSPNPLSPAGVLPVILESEVATTGSLGVVQVGNGLSITPDGVLSATGGSGSLCSVKLVTADYTALNSDCYIGAKKKDIEIKLPAGVVGKQYIVKNQVSGQIEVKTTNGEKIDNSSSKTLGTDDSLTVIFDGSRWNVI